MAAVPHLLHKPERFCGAADFTVLSKRTALTEEKRRPFLDPDLKIVARDDDTKLYLQQELQKNGIYDMADEEFASELIRKLTQGADGM